MGCNSTKDRDPELGMGGTFTWEELPPGKLPHRSSVGMENSAHHNAPQNHQYHHRTSTVELSYIKDPMPYRLTRWEFKTNNVRL